MLLNWQVKAKSLIGRTCGNDSEHYAQFVKCEGTASRSPAPRPFESVKALGKGSAQAATKPHLSSRIKILDINCYHSPLSSGLDGNGKKNMIDMSEECLNIINEQHFSVVDPGPLHTPIFGFSFRLNDKLTLILETDIDSKATSTAVEHPPGTVRVSVERAKLGNIVGVKAELVGVVPYSVKTAEGNPKNMALKERAQVHCTTVSPGDVATADYTIDWHENLPNSLFIWPDSIGTTTNTTKTRSIGMADGGLTISHPRS
jgi:hypothetical protein